MNVPFFDFNHAPSSLKIEWSAAIERVIKSGQFIGGSEVTNFEESWAKYLEIEYAIGVANGLDAITLGLKALNIGSGSKVAVPSHTFIATWLAVEAVGATPVGIDCDDHGLMNLNLLEMSEHKFDAVIPVHMHGQMVDMLRLLKWAKLNEVRIIEDCAQAHGAEIQGRFAGTWGDIGAFSFYPTKNLGALGDGGMIVTHNQELAKKVRSFGNYGSTQNNKYVYSQKGVNSRLDPIQAAVLGVNLKYLDNWNSRRREIASEFIDTFSSAGIKILVSKLEESVWHHFIVLVENRDLVRDILESKGIYTEMHYPQCAEDSYTGIIPHESSQPETARWLAKRTLSLPISPWMTDNQVTYVLDTITSSNVLRNFQGGM
jgi:dTDP-4-amino-4,6-dideoxygalactose transaminase